MNTTTYLSSPCHTVTLLATSDSFIQGNPEPSPISSGRCRAQMAGYPTDNGGKGMCRSWAKVQTATITLAAHGAIRGVTACKENINIRFAGEKWGTTRKGPKNFAAERAFVDPLLDPNLIDEAVYLELTVLDPISGQRVPKYPDFLFLFNEYGLPFTEPSEVETFIGHVTGPQGPRSNLTLVQVVRNASLHFTVKSMDDSIDSDQWLLILLSMQENGVGAMRSQGYGRLDFLRWERIAGDAKHVKGDWEGNGFERKMLTAEQISEMQAVKNALEEAGEIVRDDSNGMVKVGVLG
jgi:hypothetical protein